MLMLNPSGGAQQRSHTPQYGFHPYGPPQGGEVRHRRGRRGPHNEIVVNCKLSPRDRFSHTLELHEDQTGDQIAWWAIQVKVNAYGPLPAGRGGIVVFHKSRPIYGIMTAVDFEIESGDTLYLKTYDEFGNRVNRCEGVAYANVPIKNVHVDQPAYRVLDEAYLTNPRFDADEDELRQLVYDVAPLTRAIVRDWFDWRRATDRSGAGDDAQRNPNIRAARAHAQAFRVIQQVSTTLVEQQSRRLRVEGEYVRIAPDAVGATWSTLIPRYYDVTLSTALPPITAVAPGLPLLDTGNQAITMINDATAAAAGILSDPSLGRIQINGVNGTATYPMAYIQVEIRGVRLKRVAAVGGQCGLLVGQDIIRSLLALGFTIGEI